MRPINEYFIQPDEPELGEWTQGYVSGWNDAMEYVKRNGMEATSNLL
jgi:hypothetical protein